MFGTCCETSHVVNANGLAPNGFLISEKAGLPEALQELVPKFTNKEFWAFKLLIVHRQISKASDWQINFFTILVNLLVSDKLGVKGGSFLAKCWIGVYCMR